MLNPLTARKYWDSVWEETPAHGAVNPRDRSLRNHVNRAFDSLFKRTFLRTPGAKLIELGCANSAWLPYFAKNFGYQVTGVDYSPLGCEQARNLLARSGVSGTVVLTDMFAPPDDLLHKFDYVMSMGLVEHFKATTECIKSCTAFLKPEGVLLTIIPNMRGLVGYIQKRLGLEVYDLHVPLDLAALRAAHERAGLQIVDAGYFCFINFGVLNLAKIRKSWPGLMLSRVLNAISLAVWALERAGLKLPPNSFTSPYIVCVANSPQPEPSPPREA